MIRSDELDEIIACLYEVENYTPQADYYAAILKSLKNCGKEYYPVIKEVTLEILKNKNKTGFNVINQDAKEKILSIYAYVHVKQDIRRVFNFCVFAIGISLIALAIFNPFSITLTTALLIPALIISAALVIAPLISEYTGAKRLKEGVKNLNLLFSTPPRFTSTESGEIVKPPTFHTNHFS
jgi:hypothetical protein